MNLGFFWIVISDAPTAADDPIFIAELTPNATCGCAPRGLLLVALGSVLTERFEKNVLCGGLIDPFLSLLGVLNSGGCNNAVDSFVVLLLNAVAPGRIK